MTQSLIQSFTLREIIDLYDMNLASNEIVVLDSTRMEDIELNHPSKSISFGLLLVTEGEAVIGVDFQDVRLQEKNIVFLFPNNIFEFKELSANCQIKGVLVSIDFFSGLNLQITSQEVLNTLSNNFSKVAVVNDEIFNIISNHISRIKNLNTPDVSNMFKEEMFKLYFSLIMYELTSFTVEQAATGHMVTIRKEDIAMQFVTLIAVDFKMHKDVQYYADKLLITRTHLTRIIKEVLGKTPKQIIEGKIIAEAKVLLLKNEISIIQVMSEINFNDQAAFSKFFKKNTGVSPNLYRKQMMRS